MTRKFSSISIQTTLATGISNSALVVPVAVGSGSTLLGGVSLSGGNTDRYSIIMDPDTVNAEIMAITGVSSDNMTVLRGQDGTSAISHTAGAIIKHVITGGDLAYFTASAAPTGDLANTGLPLPGSTSGVVNVKTVAIAGTNTMTVPAATDTFVGQATADTLTNKTIIDPKIVRAINNQVGTTYTLVLTDQSKEITVSNASPVALSVPTNASVAFPIGAVVRLTNKGVGLTTIAAVAPGTTTITSLGVVVASPTLRQNGTVFLTQIATDLWTVAGDVTGVTPYAAPTIGSTAIPSAATVTTIAGLTLTAPVLGAATATSINATPIPASTTLITVNDTPFAGKNKILNSDFGIWQNGTSFVNPVNGTFLADKFLTIFDGTGGTTTWSRQSFTPGAAPVAGYEGKYFLRHACTVAPTGQSYNTLQQQIQDVQTFAGQQVTFSFWCKADAVRTIPLAFYQNFGSGGSARVAVTGGIAYTTTSWQRFTFTTTIPNIAGKTIGTGSYLQLEFDLPASTIQTIDIWGIQVEAGANATVFTTATGNPQTELLTIDLSPLSGFTLALPTTTDTLVGRATVDVLSNKNIDFNTNTILNYPNSSGKNKLFNADFSIWQNGVSGSNNSFAAGTGINADYWQDYAPGNAITVSRQPVNDIVRLDNIRYCARVQRNAGQTSTTSITHAQSISTTNSTPLVGSNVVLSFWARAGANYSNGGNLLNYNILSGTGIDQGILAGFTGQTNVGNAAAALTTNWQKYSVSGLVPTNATELGVQFVVAPTGTAGANDYFEITGVQLEIGTQLTTFSTATGNAQSELLAVEPLTGTGSIVLNNSPILITPNLGVPSAIDLTNATNLPINPAGKNKLLNGDFGLFQRASFASQTSNGYAFDRWYINMVGTVTVTQQTSGAPVGSGTYARSAYNANGSGGNFFTALESGFVNSVLGKTVTISLLVRSNAAWQTAGQGITVNVQKNSTPNTLGGGAWSTIAYTITPFASITTGTSSSSWTPISVTFTVPNDGTAQGIRLLIQENAVGASVIGGYYEVANAQLEVGPVATTFSTATGNPASELAACQRYYQRLSMTSSQSSEMFGFGISNSASYVILTIPTTSPLRTVPSISVNNNANFRVWDGSLYTTTTLIGLNASGSNQTVNIFAQVAGGLNITKPYFLLPGSGLAAYIEISAEL